MAPRRRGDGWRGPSFRGEFPTLGHQVAEWIESWCVIPDGVDAGQPFRLTDEQYAHLCQDLRLKPDARVDVYKPSAPFVHMHTELVRPQKWGKNPFGAAWVCSQAWGPVLFDGWDANGEPVGRPWPTPWIQVIAVSEGQTDNTWRALVPMIQQGPLYEIAPDTGLTRINIAGGGFIEPVTSSATSRLGQRITGALRDETHSWLESNRGHWLADTIRRNLAGMGGRSLGLSNAYDQSERSDLQVTVEAHMPDTYVNWPDPLAGSLRNKRERRRILKRAYGDSYWIDLDRIESDAVALIEKGKLDQAERFFANKMAQLGDVYMPVASWKKIADPRIKVPDGAIVALGFDGSESDDWTAFRARWLHEDGSMHAFMPSFLDGKPMRWDPAEHGGIVPPSEVHAAKDELFERYTVVRGYFDPPYWQTEIDEWASENPDQVIRWETYRIRQMAYALERLRTDVTKAAKAKPGERLLTQDGDAVTHDHVSRARSVRRPGGTIVGKPSPAQKIDLFVADALAHEAACDAIAAGQHIPAKKRSRRAGGF